MFATLHTHKNTFKSCFKIGVGKKKKRTVLSHL